MHLFLLGEKDTARVEEKDHFSSCWRPCRTEIIGSLQDFFNKFCTLRWQGVLTLQHPASDRFSCWRLMSILWRYRYVMIRPHTGNHILQYSMLINYGDLQSKIYSEQTSGSEVVFSGVSMPTVQDELLQDTTEGQALRDSWRSAVPNARPWDFSATILSEKNGIHRLLFSTSSLKERWPGSNFWHLWVFGFVALASPTKGWFGSTDDLEYTVGDFAKNGKAIYPGDQKPVAWLQFSDVPRSFLSQNFASSLSLQKNDSTLGWNTNWAVNWDVSIHPTIVM